MDYQNSKRSLKIPIKEIDFVLKNLPTKKILGSDVFTDVFCQTFKEEIPSLKRTEERNTFQFILQDQNYPYNKTKDISRKLNYKASSLKNIEAKILNEKIKFINI